MKKTKSIQRTLYVVSAKSASAISKMVLIQKKSKLKMIDAKATMIKKAVMINLKFKFEIPYRKFSNLFDTACL